MAGAQIVIDSNAPEISAKLNQLAALYGPEQMRLVYGQMGAYLERSQDDRFALQVDPEGRPWAPLSELTKERKPKNKEKILQMEGYLRDSFHYQIAADGLAFGTNDIRAATHQFGAKRGAFGQDRRGRPIPWGDIPAREMLGLSRDDRDELLGILADHLSI